MEFTQVEAVEDLMLQMEQDPYQLVAEVPVDQELPQDQGCPSSSGPVP